MRWDSLLNMVGLAAPNFGGLSNSMAVVAQTSGTNDPSGLSENRAWCRSWPGGNGGTTYDSKITALPSDGREEFRRFYREGGPKGYHVPGTERAQKIEKAWADYVWTHFQQRGASCQFNLSKRMPDTGLDLIQHHDWWRNRFGVRQVLVDWSPLSVLEDEPEPSNRKRKTVFFRDPNLSLSEKGFAGVVFDVEYQFLACSGELHLAYSLVENSVGVGRLAGGGDRVVTN